MVQGEQFWAQVYSFALELEKKAPSGSRVVVEIETFDGERFAPGTVQRVPPWLICQTAKTGEDVVSEILYVREEDIRRVHIRQEQSDKPMGFSVGEVKP